MLFNRSAGAAGLVDKDVSAPYAAAKNAEVAAASAGLKAVVIDATNPREVDAAFASLNAFLLATSPLFKRSMSALGHKRKIA